MSGWRYFLDPWWREDHVYLSPMASDDCRRALNESTTPFLGLVRRSFMSSADYGLNRMTFYANSFKPFAHVRLADCESGGTLVRVTLSGSRYCQAFMAVWFGFVVLWILASLPGVLQEGPPGFMFPLAGLGLAGFAFLLNAFGRAIASGDRRFLIGFLRDELRLQDPPPSASPISASR